jgi:hypothetical protein
MKKKELKAALKREKYERECLGLGLGHASNYIAKLQAEVAELKAQGSGQWAPVEDGVTGDADGGMMLTISDDGQTIMLRDDSPGCKEFELGDDMRICRKVEGAVVGTTNEVKLDWGGEGYQDADKYIYPVCSKQV